MSDRWYVGRPGAGRWALLPDGTEAQNAAAADWEVVALVDAAECERLQVFYDRIADAHKEHLRTGDYMRLGIVAQDALREAGDE